MYLIDISNRGIMTERNRTKYIVLGMLTIRDMSGYDISKAIETSTNYFWSESPGQLYPVLACCLKEGLVRCKEQSTKRVKKVYSITAEGKKKLKAWLKKQPQNTLVRSELLLKLFFGGNVSTADNIEHIRQHQIQLEQEIGAYSAIREGILQKHKASSETKYWLITLDYGLKVSQAELEWCHEALQVLKGI